MRPDYVTLGAVMVAIYFLLQVASLVVSIWQRTRRSPSVDVSLQEYVRRREFEEHCKRNEDVTGQLFDLLREQQREMVHGVEGMRKDLAEWQKVISYQLGALDGRVHTVERKPQ